MEDVVGGYGSGLGNAVTDQGMVDQSKVDKENLLTYKRITTAPCALQLVCEGKFLTASNHRDHGDFSPTDEELFLGCLFKDSKLNEGCQQHDTRFTNTNQWSAGNAVNDWAYTNLSQRYNPGIPRWVKTLQIIVDGWDNAWDRDITKVLRFLSILSPQEGISGILATVQLLHASHLHHPMMTVTSAARCCNPQSIVFESPDFNNARMPCGLFPWMPLLGECSHQPPCLPNLFKLSYEIYFHTIVSMFYYNSHPPGSRFHGRSWTDIERYFLVKYTDAFTAAREELPIIELPPWIMPRQENLPATGSSFLLFQCAHDGCQEESQFFTAAVEHEENCSHRQEEEEESEEEQDEVSQDQLREKAAGEFSDDDIRSFVISFIEWDKKWANIKEEMMSRDRTFNCNRMACQNLYNSGNGRRLRDHVDRTVGLSMELLIDCTGRRFGCTCSLHNLTL